MTAVIFLSFALLKFLASIVDVTLPVQRRGEEREHRMECGDVRPSYPTDILHFLARVVVSPQTHIRLHDHRVVSAVGMIRKHFATTQD